MLSIQVFVDFGKVKYVRNINSNIPIPMICLPFNMKIRSVRPMIADLQHEM